MEVSVGQFLFLFFIITYQVLVQIYGVCYISSFSISLFIVLWRCLGLVLFVRQQLAIVILSIFEEISFTPKGQLLMI